MNSQTNLMMVASLLLLSSDCCSLKNNPDSLHKIQTDAVDDWSHNNLRVIRQTLRHQPTSSAHQSRDQRGDQTVIVLPNNSGFNSPYGGVPSYGNNRGQQTVIVSNSPE